MTRRGLSGAAADKILAAADYPRFKEALAASGCERCPLSRSRTHIVVDRGDPAAKILIIGEAPGENEDREARAFVGRAGKLLDAMMAEAGFDTDRDSLIINIVKCRPPDNRRPTREEAEACSPFLRKQLALVQPRAVLLLGATALRHLVPEKRVFSMKEEVGRFFTRPEFPGIRLMVLYHPAYILRDPRKKPLMAEHLRRFAAWWAEAHLST